MSLRAESFALIFRKWLFEIIRVKGGSRGRRWRSGRARPPSRETPLWWRWMVLAAAAAVADGWSGSANCTANSRRLCRRDGGPRCAPEGPSRRWPGGAAAPVAADSAASTSSCNETRGANPFPSLPVLRQMLPLPSVLIPSLHLGLRKRQGIRDVAAVRHAEIFLTAELPLEVSQLCVGEGGPPSPRLPAGRRCTVHDHPARLSGRGRRTGRRRECRRRTS